MIRLTLALGCVLLLSGCGTQKPLTIAQRNARAEAMLRMDAVKGQAWCAPAHQSFVRRD